MVKGLGGNWHCLLRFFGREKFFGGFPQLFSTFISQSSVLVCAKWMLTPPLQKKITHVPVGVFFGLILVHLFVFFWVYQTTNLVLFLMFSSHFFGRLSPGWWAKTPSNRNALRCLQPWTCRLSQKIVKRRQRRQEAIGCFWEFGRLPWGVGRGEKSWKLEDVFCLFFFLDFESRRWKKSIEFFVCESLRTEILFFRQDFKIMRYLRGQMRNQRSLCSWSTLGHSLWSRTQNVETSIWRNDIINQK